MNSLMLVKKFHQMGSRLSVVPLNGRSRFLEDAPVRIDVHSDRKGEYFELSHHPNANVDVDVIDLRPSDRHLLLMVREENAKNKFLCGHDERHWFVAGIPESAPVGTVSQAKDALQPVAVRQALNRSGVNLVDRHLRKNVAFQRQGEWFFLPTSGLVVDTKLVLLNEPLRRGMIGKPHWAEFCYRVGGETVYVNSRYRNGLTETNYQKLLRDNPQAAMWGWRVMKRNASVFVRGRIRHSDHATIVLNDWHRVLMNTENQSNSMRFVAFLD
ncbi:hypothetical protein SH668x_000954 [Planctomicrobium sp. SH668]|uniref:hypothetical protein n=1 Tax=Planctomicrobium sp. SH668 TaxID=3448126 RepID=UPI003F5CAD2D